MSLIIKPCNLAIFRQKRFDVLYFNFKKPSHADESELTDDDVIIRYENGEVVGITVLNASQRVNW